jgi:hypothetical protein
MIQEAARAVASGGWILETKWRRAMTSQAGQAAALRDGQAATITMQLDGYPEPGRPGTGPGEPARPGGRDRADLADDQS